MRRALFIGRVVLNYLLLGFVTTWAVAWGLALLPPGRDRQTSSVTISPTPHLDRDINFTTLRGVGSVRIGFATSDIWSDGFSRSVLLSAPMRLREELDDPTISRFTLAIDPSHDGAWGHRSDSYEFQADTARPVGVDDARGFPALSHWCSWEAFVPIGGWGFHIHAKRGPIGGIQIPPLTRVARNIHGPVFRALPYMPIWSGLALNTAFYALLFFVCVRLVKGTRHLLRFRTGRCPRCGYDLLGSFTGPCSECGHLACKRKNHATATA